MHSWREDTEKAIGQQVDNTSATDGLSSTRSSRIDTPTTLVAHTPHAPDEKACSSQTTAGAALDGQTSLSVPAKVPDKNPFGLKPEYKTALKDFFVCLSQIVSHA